LTGGRCSDVVINTGLNDNYLFGGYATTNRLRTTQKIQDTLFSLKLNNKICYMFFREVVSLILKTGFDINVRTSRGTALHEAALCGKIDVVKILLEANINVELRDQVK
jgi:ankyrin repeat protein